MSFYLSYFPNITSIHHYEQCYLAFSFQKIFRLALVYINLVGCVVESDTLPHANRISTAHQLTLSALIQFLLPTNHLPSAQWNVD